MRSHGSPQPGSSPRPPSWGSSFLLIPIALAFALAFTNAKLISPQGPQFVGVDNFTRLFQDPVFWKSLRNTILFAVFVVPIQAGFALSWRC